MSCGRFRSFRRHVKNEFAGHVWTRVFGRVVAVGPDVTVFASATKSSVFAVALSALRDRRCRSCGGAAFAVSCESWRPSRWRFWSRITVDRLRHLTGGVGADSGGAAGRHGRAADRAWAGRSRDHDRRRSGRRDLTIALGAECAFDSRSGAFVDDVMRVTEGSRRFRRLNSLAGQAIENSIGLLQPLDDSSTRQRDYLANTPVGQTFPAQPGAILESISTRSCVRALTSGGVCSARCGGLRKG